MKLEPVTKLDKRNTAALQKILTTTPCLQIATLILFFQFVTNLEKTENQIPDVQSLKLTFLLAVTFILQKLKTD